MFPLILTIPPFSPSQQGGGGCRRAEAQEDGAPPADGARSGREEHAHREEQPRDGDHIHQERRGEEENGN